MPDMLYEINTISVALRISMAMILGGVLGIERGRKHRPAGFRTYMLVCLGTTVVMLTNQYVYERFGSGDPVRMGAQVISGIGFLGAGTIMVTGHNQVKGLTTAAGLWAAACIGLAIGIGFYEGAFVGGAAIIAILICFHRVDGFILGRSRRMELYVEVRSVRELNGFLKCVKKMNLELRNVLMDSSENSLPEGMAAIVVLQLNKKSSHDDVIDELREVSEIRYLEEI